MKNPPRTTRGHLRATRGRARHGHREKASQDEDTQRLQSSAELNELQKDKTRFGAPRAPSFERLPGRTAVALSLMRNLSQGYMRMSPSLDFFPDVPDAHVVHLYRGARSLGDSVLDWTHRTLINGGGALMVCTPDNAAMIRAKMQEEGLDPVSLEREGRFVVLHVDDLIEQCFRTKMPHPPSFARRAGEIIHGLKTACGPGKELRAWGEAVSVLWKRGERAAAHDLESLWNQVIAKEGLRLLCTYDTEKLDALDQECLFADVSATHGRIAIDAMMGRARSTLPPFLESTAPAPP